jgi:hypothetical protein
MVGAGERVGLDVGALVVGEEVGAVGAVVGETVGVRVGAAEAVAVGAGEKEGADVLGEAVGAAVMGAAVGRAVLGAVVAITGGMTVIPSRALLLLRSLNHLR